MACRTCLACAISRTNQKSVTPIHFGVTLFISLAQACYVAFEQVVRLVSYKVFVDLRKS